mgnify:CR=1 FL=1
MENKTCRECKKTMNVMCFVERTSLCVPCYDAREHRQMMADPYMGDDFALYNQMEAW